MPRLAPGLHDGCSLMGTCACSLGTCNFAASVRTGTAWIRAAAASLSACGVDASPHLGGLRLAQEGLVHFEESEVCQGQRHARPAAEKPTWLHAPEEG